MADYISGRSIVQALRAVVHLWGVFGASLRAHIPEDVAAALDTLAANMGILEALDPEGPQ